MVVVVVINYGDVVGVGVVVVVVEVNDVNVAGAGVIVILEVGAVTGVVVICGF